VEKIFSFLENFESIYASTSYQRGIFFKAKEELLEYIYSAIRYAPDTSAPEFMRRIKDANNFEELNINQKNKYSKILKTHNAVVSNLNENDSIISFNWDLLLDTALWVNNKEVYFALRDELLNPFGACQNQLGRRYGYFSGDDIHQGYFFKMHGSVNLASCTNKNCIRFNFPVVLDEFEAETPDLLQCDVCFAPIQILIIPPHGNKSYRSNRFFKLQAGIAAQKLQIAEEIISIGYSFPDFDLEANSLMRLARLDPKVESDDTETFLKKIIVVNKEVDDKEYVEKIIDIFGLDNCPKTHGHRVDLELYNNVDGFIENYFDYKKHAQPGATLKN
jgi:hypothetical protein